jgi:hypothetical protein
MTAASAASRKRMGCRFRVFTRLGSQPTNINFGRLSKNTYRAVSQGENQLKAPGSKLIGKDPIRSAFSFELPAAFMRAFPKRRATLDHGLGVRFSTACKASYGF